MDRYDFKREWVGTFDWSGREIFFSEGKAEGVFFGTPLLHWTIYFYGCPEMKKYIILS